MNILNILNNANPIEGIHAIEGGERFKDAMCRELCVFLG
jgi:hypothetical protein